MSRLTNTLPPTDIFDVLHDYEARGGTIPDVVDSWWEIETGFTWREQEARLKAVEVGEQPTTAPCCSVDDSHIPEAGTST